MAKDDDQSGKTEQPTAKRLKDARKDGNVPKSRELTSTAVMLVWLLAFGLGLHFISGELGDLVRLCLDAVGRPFPEALARVGTASLHVLFAVLGAMVGAVMGTALLVEFLQAGPVFALKRITPDLGRLNPAEGLKRLFSMDNVVEVLKSLAKTAALVAIVALVVRASIGQLLRLPFSRPAAVADAYWSVSLRVGVVVIGTFCFLSLADVLYARFSHARKLRMTREEVKREHREQSGDPHVKGHRRQLHREWANENVRQAVRNATAVVTNPTHVAVALRYVPGETVVPMVTAKGVEHMARLIRETAEEAGIPILQNIPLARGLNGRVEVDDYIPEEFFAAVAELLRWAQSVRAQ